MAARWKWKKGLVRGGSALELSNRHVKISLTVLPSEKGWYSSVYLDAHGASGMPGYENTKEDAQATAEELAGGLIDTVMGQIENLGKDLP